MLDYTSEFEQSYHHTVLLMVRKITGHATWNTTLSLLKRFIPMQRIFYSWDVQKPGKNLEKKRQLPCGSQYVDASSQCSPLTCVR